MLFCLLGEEKKIMWDNLRFVIFFTFLERAALFCPWLLLCLGIIAIAVISGEKKLARLIAKIAAGITICALLTVWTHDISYITKHVSMQAGIWLALCLSVTILLIIVHLVNKKIRKKKPIHWVKKLAGYAAFYVAFCVSSLFIIMKFFGEYPGNWLGTDKEYRELAYGLHHLKLECYEYAGICEGSHKEIVIVFNDTSSFGDHVLRRTAEQRDYVTIKFAVEEYIKENISFQGKRLDIKFRLSSGETINHFYNFNPWTGEVGTERPYWFATHIDANNCTELAEFYHDFSGISGTIYSMEGIRDIENLTNLCYLELYMSGNAKEEMDLEEQYLEEIKTLLPDCEIYLNQNTNIHPDWENFPD